MEDNTVRFQPGDMLVEDYISGEACWAYFSQPVDVLLADRFEQVESCMAKIEEYRKKGFFVAGYISYEASEIHRTYNQFTDSDLDDSELARSKSTRSDFMQENTHALLDYPLLWLGVYREKQYYTLPSTSNAPNQNYFPQNNTTEWTPDITVDEYTQQFNRIKAEIAEGNTYQVNYTFRLKGKIQCSPFDFFLKMQKAQGRGFGAYLHLGSHHICSASPELFFLYQQGQVTARPMKGTGKRLDDPQRDAAVREWLRTSDKNRAENVMIVDMLRNDMGRLAEKGTVNVKALCEIETYPTVYQMTSTIEAKTMHSATEVFESMFPCASVTGAPKISTMKLIQSIEKNPRGIYTGSMGYFSPLADSFSSNDNNYAQFNVAIRTAVVESDSGNVEYGVGSGVIWGSTAEEEYAECLAKAAILNEQ